MRESQAVQIPKLYTHCLVSQELFSKTNVSSLDPSNSAWPWPCCWSPDRRHRGRRRHPRPLSSPASLREGRGGEVGHRRLLLHVQLHLRRSGRKLCLPPTEVCQPVEHGLVVGRGGSWGSVGGGHFGFGQTTLDQGGSLLHGGPLRPLFSVPLCQRIKKDPGTSL